MAMRELSNKEVSEVSGGAFSTSASCTAGIIAGAIGALIALPSVFGSLGSLVAGAIGGGCFNAPGGGEGGHPTIEAQ